MEWLKGGKALKRKQETTELDFKKEMNRKRKEWRWALKRLRGTNKKEHRYG
ncbi:hypothetical protein [Hoylesella nanceiensis]|uniref:hypothetical protein n=1 Tax=Hoylesella nanceiensis TaxID=425941 RepID=UPI0024A90ED0|nr:hypothetical protein [Hoylesella nanceiensis]